MEQDDEDNLTYFDLAVAICPHCSTPIAESGWYGVDMESDIVCYECDKSFNIKRNVSDRVIVEIEVDESGKVCSLDVGERVKNSKD